ncbi:MATE family efflux transporter [Glycomyces algeriensis]|uniref:Probable multidrug resistance protein NorM n=1 Tax=Glycomyces algeriensis TaxID=256037 RepID=A0A9W6G9W6_9ACTN|nr:MATE family efflux transporter [Glycomyces algeriensis]MDA1364307.1 MATE family efflux transporter [Glycomyces algeriensis]MDR7350339.1 MATE family multidrug resistance protein [Glycomyces algeriensis]GLI43045.1 putative multidrug resistance protein NorM [Glycomyces algeriensis]
MPRPTRADHRALAALAAPLAATQLAQVALSTTDVVMMGFLGTTALAGGGLAIVLFNQVRTMGVGLLTGTANLIAAASARRADGEIRRIALTAMLIATLTGAAGAVVLVGIGFLLEPLGQAHEVAQAARHMLFALAPGLIPCLWFQVLRQTTVGLQRHLQLLWVTLGSVALNIALNFALLHGIGPFPALGLAGIGAATSAVHLAQALVLFALMRRDPVVRAALRPGPQRPGTGSVAHRILRLGVPTALTYGSEAGLFSVLALLAGGLGATALAAYNVVNQITYIVFQTAVGTSHAASVLVSHDAAGPSSSPRRWAATALIQQAGLLVLVGLVYFAFGPLLVQALAADATEATIALAATVLIAAAVTQFADAAQNIAVGLLRGIDQAGAGFRATLIGYWAVGLPAAALFAFGLDWGLIGLWIGLGCGLAACAALMLARFHAATRAATP